MKSSFTTLAIAVFALTLQAPLLAQSDDSSEGAPVVSGLPQIPAIPASYPSWLSEPGAGHGVAPAIYASSPDSPSKQKAAQKDCQCSKCQTKRFGGSWGGIEYLHIWMRGRDLPPLATTSPAGTPPNQAGVLPTQILFGNDQIGTDLQPAGRLDFGIWRDAAQTKGIGFRLFGIEGDSTRFDATSNGSPILAVPYFNADLGVEDAVEVAIPGLFAGSINHRTSNDLLMGEIYGRLTLARGCGYRMDLLGGYHVIRLDDSLGIQSTTEFLAGGVFPQGTIVNIYDSFKARNEMHGGSIGFMSELTQGPWSLQGLFKLTIANTRQTVNIFGESQVDQGGAPIIFNNGTFAQASNIGEYQRDKLTYVPELNLKLGYDINACWKMTIGYTFIYFPHVLLAGDQVDRNISASQFTPVPAFAFNETDQWAQGMSFGLEWNF